MILGGYSKVNCLCLDLYWDQGGGSVHFGGIANLRKT